MDIDKYVKEKGRGSSYYKSALRLAYDYHKDMGRSRLVILLNKARDENRIAGGTHLSVATCMIICELLK